MKLHLVRFMIWIIILAEFGFAELYREYTPIYSNIYDGEPYCWDEDEFYPSYEYNFCVECIRYNLIENKLGVLRLSKIPTNELSPCVCCGSPSICYAGYFDPDFNKYFFNLNQQLGYSVKCFVIQEDQCRCLWPEESHEAAAISNLAYLLFKNLITTTALSELAENPVEQKKFLQNTTVLDLHKLTISFIVHQFRFSDYYTVIQDIEKYAISKYNEREAAKIKDALMDIIEALYPKFLSLYSNCLAKHPTPEIKHEIKFMKLLINDISGLDSIYSSTNSLLFTQVDLFTSCDEVGRQIQIEEKTLHSKGNKKNNSYGKKNQGFDFEKLISHSEASPWEQERHIFSETSSEVLLEEGTIFNSLLLYNQAIPILTKAIKRNTNNRNAYIERAIAYFETNQLNLALKDYEKAKSLTVLPPFRANNHKAMAIPAVYVPEDKKEFSKGLVSGTLEGAKISTIEFVPSIFSSCRGIVNGLWAFACSPKEVSQEMINSAYALGEFIGSSSANECFQQVVPELKELSISWHNLDDRTRGQKIGFIIGKYGVDIFAPIGLFKGVGKIKALRRANAMCTLEICSASKNQQTIIINESIKRATLRESVINESVKKGKILTKTSNVQYHVMQPKHAWDKVLNLSGNIEEDFKKVVAFLEDKNIVNQKYLKNTVALPKDAPVKNIHLLEYRTTIEGQQVQVFFEKYLDTGELFLKNGWVVTK